MGHDIQSRTARFANLSDWFDEPDAPSNSVLREPGTLRSAPLLGQNRSRSIEKVAIAGWLRVLKAGGLRCPLGNVGSATALVGPQDRRDVSRHRFAFHVLAMGADRDTLIDGALCYDDTLIERPRTVCA